MDVMSNVEGSEDTHRMWPARTPNAENTHRSTKCASRFILSCTNKTRSNGRSAYSFTRTPAQEVRQKPALKQRRMKLFALWNVSDTFIHYIHFRLEKNRKFRVRSTVVGPSYRPRHSGHSSWLLSQSWQVCCLPWLAMACRVPLLS